MCNALYLLDAVPSVLRRPALPRGAAGVCRRREIDRTFGRCFSVPFRFMAGRSRQAGSSLRRAARVPRPTRFLSLPSLVKLTRTSLCRSSRLPRRDDVRSNGLLPSEQSRTGVRFDEETHWSTVGNAPSHRRLNSPSNVEFSFILFHYRTK